MTCDKEHTFEIQTSSCVDMECVGKSSPPPREETDLPALQKGPVPPLILVPNHHLSAFSCYHSAFFFLIFRIE